MSASRKKTATAMKPTRPGATAKSLGRKHLYGKTYVVRQAETADATGRFRNLYDTSDGADNHIACLQVGKDGLPGGLTVYREWVPGTLILWLIALPSA